MSNSVVVLHTVEKQMSLEKREGLVSVEGPDSGIQVSVDGKAWDLGIGLRIPFEGEVIYSWADFPPLLIPYPYFFLIWSIFRIYPDSIKNENRMIGRILPVFNGSKECRKSTENDQSVPPARGGKPFYRPVAE